MARLAVIVAAGMGTRLKEKTSSIPKGFLPLGGKTLIERSIANLRQSGIKKILIGTGYLSEIYEDFAANYSDIECIKSDRFESTSSMYTLYNMRNYIDEDFLLLESDLLYEQRALATLQSDSQSDLILASGRTFSNDEVYIETDDNGFLMNMSKVEGELQNIFGELVGISKVSLERLELLERSFLEIDNPKIDYEYTFVYSTRFKPFKVKKIDDLIWCEIDDESHLTRAERQILPKVREKDE